MATFSLILFAIIAMASAGGPSRDNSGQGFDPFKFVGLPSPSQWANFPLSSSSFGFAGTSGVVNAKPGPGGSYSGVMMSSSSSVTDKDGKVIKTGGTRAIINNNGVVKEYRSTDDSGRIEEPGIFIPDFESFEMPDLETFKMPKFEPIVIPDIPDIPEIPDIPDIPDIPGFPSQKPRKFKKYQPLKMKPMKFKSIKFDPIKFDPIKFDPIKIDPIKFDPIKIDPIKFDPIPDIDPEEIKNYKPKPNEHYVGMVSKTSSYSTNDNGVVKSGGSHSKIVNVDGHVEEKKAVYGDGGHQEE